MALINCPECGKQISDKAEACPNCGIDIQEALAKVHEKQRNRKRRTIVSIVSVCIVAAIVVLAYLYFTDALNSIPADYRKQTEACFADCESAIQNGNFKSGIQYLNTLKSRTLTNRQAKHAMEMEKALAEIGLSELENIAQIDLSYREIQRLAQNLQAMDLSESQQARLDVAMKEAERIKKPMITAKGVEPFLLDASFPNIPPQGDYYDHIVLDRFYLVAMGEAGLVDITEDELGEFYDIFGSDAEVLEYFGTGVVMQGQDTMLITKYDKQGIIFYVEVFSKEISFENGIHVGMSSETMASQYNASFLTTDYIEGLAWMCYYVKEIPNNITLTATNNYDIFDGGEDEFGIPYYPTSGELIKNNDYISGYSYKVPMDKVKDSYLKSIRILKKDYKYYNFFND